MPIGSKTEVSVLGPSASNVGSDGVSVYDISSFNAFVYHSNGRETLKLVSTSSDGTWRYRTVRSQLTNNQGNAWNSKIHT